MPQLEQMQPRAVTFLGVCCSLDLLLPLPLSEHRCYVSTALCPLPLCSALEQVQPRVVSYEEQVTTLREGLADLHEREEDWSKAAQTLAGIDLDSGWLAQSRLVGTKWMLWLSGCLHGRRGKWFVVKLACT